MIDLPTMPCTDCGYDTIGNEYYMVRNDLWERALGHKYPPQPDKLLPSGGGEVVRVPNLIRRRLV